MTDARPRLGLVANAPQFALLVAINAFVGAMIGLERSVLPLLADQEFGIAATSVTLSFIVAFGIVKAGANLLAGHLADRGARKRLLVWGWIAALPVPAMIIWAPSWGWVVAANVLLGVNQGLAWSATVIMKIDLAGPRRRGLAMGLNEVAGYGAVALFAWGTGLLAAAYGPRPAPYLLGFGISITGLLLSVLFVKETAGHAAEEARQGRPLERRRSFGEVFGMATVRDRSLSSICQAGLVTNLKDGMAWGLLPIYLAAQGLDVARIGAVAAVYPAVWAFGQIPAGVWSDRVGRKPLIVGGLWLQAAGIAGFVVSGGYALWMLSAVVLGAGTALVYPTLLAGVGDRAHPSWRATAVGVYRLWRDLGYAVGALLAGIVADLLGAGSAITVVGAVVAVTGVLVLIRMDETLSTGPAGHVDALVALQAPTGTRELTHPELVALANPEAGRLAGDRSHGHTAVTVRALAGLVPSLEGVTRVTFHAVDGYAVTLDVEEALRAGVVLVPPITTGRSGVRLVVDGGSTGCLNVKAVRRIELGAGPGKHTVDPNPHDNAHVPGWDDA